jgi:hypothetical protein
VTLVVLVGACGSTQHAASPPPSSRPTAPTSSEPTSTEPTPVARAGATAIWTIGPDDGGAQHLTSQSTSFTAYVSRLACSGGQTGTVLEPTIDRSETDVTVTFTVEALPPGAYTCPGSPPVPFTVDLGLPIGNRRLIDGACRPGSDAATTSWCVGGAVRWHQ